jgi:PAS domain S-box-containing protein
MPWGTHFCHFYESKQDLLDLLVPYFKAGLENNEFCLCVSCPPIGEAELLTAMRAAIPDFDRHLARRSIEIVTHHRWYLENGRFEGPRVIEAWRANLADALRRGYSGMRAQGNEAWLTDNGWGNFVGYEKKLNEALVDLRMIVLCTYPLTRTAGEIFDVAHVHEFAVAKRAGHWEVLETPAVKRAKAELLTEKATLERRVHEKTRELASATAEVSREMAERKRTQRSLRARDEKTRLLMDTLPIAVFDCDPEGLIEYFNPQAIALWGRVPVLRDVRDRYCGSFRMYCLNGDPMPHSSNPMAEVLRSGVAKLNQEVVMERPDGTRVVVLASVVPLKDEHGQITGAVSCMMDITDRKRTEALLHAREQEFRTVVENTPDQIIRYDRQLRRIFVNPAFEAAYEAPKGTLLGKPAGLLPKTGEQLAKPEEIATLHGFIQAVFDSGKPREFEIGWPLPTGRRTFSVRLAPEFDLHGVVTSVLGVGRDITNLKAAEEALRQSQAELTRVARVSLVGELTASLAHELNQPLAGVVSNAEACLRWLVTEPPDFEEAREALHRIIRDGGRASNVVTRTRSLLKKGEPVKTAVKLDDLIAETIALTQDETRRRQVALRIQLAPDLPLVAADRVQVQQVLLNLLMNALDAVSEVADRPPQIEVHATVESTVMVRVSVEDSGIGIDPQQAKRLFEAFYTTKAHGLGMGLSISRSIIEAHGGRIWAVPTARGAKFVFTLPILGATGS